MKVKLERILLATDFSEQSERAIPYARALARTFHAQLTVFHAVDVSTVTIYGEAMVDPEEVHHRVQEYTRDYVNQWMSGKGVEFEPRVALGRPADEIAYCCQSRAADLVVTATRGRSGLERMVLGSVTEKLMHTLNCPLLAVRETGRKVDEERIFNRILVGADFSVDSNLAVEYGLGLAQEFQAEVHLAHVIDPKAFKNLMEPGAAPQGPDQPVFRERINERLTAMIPSEANYWCRPVTAVLAGRPYDELAKYAVINQMDMVVLGVHGRGFVEKMLVGSTLDRMIRHGPVPVLAVRST
jgi:nucleotide-binding universal stress UspA family protein